jgi:hypothetical protein
MGKKGKEWGHVQAARKISRVDRSVMVLDKVVEYKKRTNLDDPAKKMKGLMRSNPFQALQVDVS